MKLSQRCDKQRSHAKWNPQVVDGKVVFPTHEEASYPILLCSRLASIVKDKALSFGAIEISTLREQLDKPQVSGQRFIINMLPRGKKFKPLVSEFGGYQKHAFKINDEDSTAMALKSLPKGAKALHRLIKVGILRHDGGSNIDVYSRGNLCNTDHNVDAEVDPSDWQSSVTTEVIQVDVLHHPASQIPLRLEIVTFGIPREPMDFVHRAVEAGHPRTLAVHLTEGSKLCGRKTSCGSPGNGLKRDLLSSGSGRVEPKICRVKRKL